MNGYNGLYNNYSPYYHSNLINNLLYPGLAQNYYPNLYPQYIPQYAGLGQNYYPNLYPQYNGVAPYLNYPYQNSLPQSVLPTSQLAQPVPVVDPFAGRRISTSPSSSTTTTVSSSSSSPDAPATATVINPFSDSVVSVSNSPPVVVSGNVESATNEKPLLYSNQNNVASLRSPIYDTTLLHGGSYLNNPYYNNPYYNSASAYRYPTSAYSSGYYSRLASSYYPTPGYSSIYRPGFISTYPPYYNGVGYPYSSMHYSADPSILGRSAVVKEDSKPIVPKEEIKSNNLMRTVKTSKSESKETLSILNDHETPKFSLDDKKA